MRGIVAVRDRRALAIAALVVILSGCTTAPSAPTVTSTASATSSAEPRPPLAGDLVDGVPARLGSAGHWAIATTTAFIGDEDGSVRAIDLNAGATSWRTVFPAAGTPWDGTPTIGLSSDRSTVVALRTVDGPNGARLQLLRLAARTGEVIDARLVADPAHRWRVDLPPHVLAADATTLAVAEQPEWGTQVGVINLASASVTWAVRSEQGYAADDARVYTRAGALDRASGAVAWRTTAQVGPLVALTGGSVLAFAPDLGRVVWLDAATGAQRARTGPIDDADLCRPAAMALVCAGARPAGYDLTSGSELWRGETGAGAVSTLDDWAYLWTGTTRGFVVDAGSGELLVQDAVLPRLKFSNAEGILVSGDPDTWVPR